MPKNPRQKTKFRIGTKRHGFEWSKPPYAQKKFKFFMLQWKNRKLQISNRDKEPESTYNVQKIVVSVVKMLIKEFFSTEAFFTVSTPPFIYIHMNLVFLLISKHIIVAMKSTFSWKFIFFSFHEWHQMLDKRLSQTVINTFIVNEITMNFS